jgi:LacI family transcriptional regulator
MRYNPVQVIDQVAENTHSSYADVLRVFYGQKVPDDTYKAIMQAARQLDYADNPAFWSARPSIGLIMPGWLTSDYYGKLLQGIQAAAKNCGYELTVHIENANVPDESLDRYWRTLFELGYADQGFFMMTQDHFPISSHYCHTYGRPYVVGDCDVNEAVPYPSIGIDNRQAMLDVMRYVIQLGHKRIGFLNGDPDMPSAHWRMQGYLEGLEEAGLPVDENLIAVANYWWVNAQELTPALMEQTPRPTAIVAANDLMALGAMTALSQMGYRIPADVSMTGFDDIPMTLEMTPNLTTVRQPLIDMGQAVIEMLDQQIQHHTIDIPHRIFKTELVIRDSVQARSK